jgi:hypothetical protein
VIGPNGQAINLDGVNDFIKVIGNELNFSQDFSISMWVKTDENSCSNTSVSQLIQKGELCVDGNPNYNGHAYTLRFSGNYLGNALYSSECNYLTGLITEPIGDIDDDRILFSSGSKIPNIENNFQHLVVSYNNTTKQFSIYVNGVKETSQNFYETAISSSPANINPNDFSSIHQTNSTLKIGAAESWCGGVNSFTNYFKGAIDELRFYNRVITQDEIKELHGLGVNISQVFNAQQDYSITQQGYNNWYYLSYKNGYYYDMVYGINWWGYNSWHSSTETHSVLSENRGHPGILEEPSRAWESPSNGTIRITGNAHKTHIDGGNGVITRIFKNSQLLWERIISYNDSIGYDFDITTTVIEGDYIYFRINNNGTSSYDGTYFNPTIELF